MAAPSFRVAIDLGAGSGRAFLGATTADRLQIEELHRFHYGPRPVDGHLRWDLAQLFTGIITGLRLAQTRVPDAEIASIGVDSWAVDYGLLDADDALLEEPICYRDERTAGVIDTVLARVPREALFARTGIQVLPLNTLYQLVAHHRDGLPPGAARLLLIPDLCHHFLCGARVSERTNASTTQLLDARTGTWDDELCTTLGLRRTLLPALVEAGTDLGPLRPERIAELSHAAPDDGASGDSAATDRAATDRAANDRAANDRPPDARARELWRRVRVIAPGTHDTASAVAGTPLEPHWAFISSGTWSLVGVERDRDRGPLLDAAVADANFTNEAGVFGTVRFLKNVMGLWLLESCRKEWTAAGHADDLPTLLTRVAAVPGFAGFIFPDAPRFFAPASMTRELRAALAETGQTAHDDPVLLAKVILDSLAARYASVLDTIETLTAHPIPGIHIVGGGSLNAYLNQATANCAQRPVLAGPVEATAIGNLIVQAITGGELSSLSAARALVRRSAPLRRFDPCDGRAWSAARERYRVLAQRGGFAA